MFVLKYICASTCLSASCVQWVFWYITWFGDERSLPYTVSNNTKLVLFLNHQISSCCSVTTEEELTSEFIK